MKLFFVDTETGGLDPSKHSLLAIGYLIYDDESDEIVDTGVIYHKADEYIVTPSALRINGLNLVEVAEKGMAKEEIIQKFKQLAEEHGKFLPAGWNLQFDVGFLKALLGEAYREVFYYKGIDIFTLYYLVYGESVSLKEAAVKVLGEHIRERQWHDALIDITTTFAIYKELRKAIWR